jgi:hypothetical protein
MINIGFDLMGILLIAAVAIAILIVIIIIISNSANQ